MKTGGWYNGFDGVKRAAKFKELKRRIACGEQPVAAGPCELCGDPDVPVEYHDEDYSQPYIWSRPAIFCLCRTCHRQKLHGRFSIPSQWLVFLAHVRRGGYARDLKDRAIKKELTRCRAALEQGKDPTLRQLRPYREKPGAEWFSGLSQDRATMLRPSSPVAVLSAPPQLGLTKGSRDPPELGGTAKAGPRKSH